ncbi:unnamed protein product [Amaranthus hypochondriacus]
MIATFDKSKWVTLKAQVESLNLLLLVIVKIVDQIWQDS